LQECDYLREIARPRLEISTVVDVATGKVCALACNSYDFVSVYQYLVYIIFFIESADQQVRILVGNIKTFFLIIYVHFIHLQNKLLMGNMATHCPTIS
jgi:hypothetical protein